MLGDPGAHVGPVVDGGEGDGAAGGAGEVGPSPFLAGDEDAERRVEFVEGGSEIADGHVGGGGRGGGPRIAKRQVGY